MKQVCIIVLAAAIAACASSGERVSQDRVQAIRDLIVVRELNEVDKLRSTTNDSFDELDPRFVIYKGSRDKNYLIEFARPCHELREYPVVADTRYESNTIRARFDTLRGCRIDKMYEISEADIAELEQIGESPGSRN